MAQPLATSLPPARPSVSVSTKYLKTEHVHSLACDPKGKRNPSVFQPRIISCVFAILHLCLLKYYRQRKSCSSCREKLCITQFFFLLFSYVSSFWNLEAWLYMFLLFFFVFFYLCSLSCPSFYSFLLFFLFPALFTPSLFIHFIFWSPLFFPFQICSPFFSLFSILSAPPLCAITIGTVLFL